MAGLPVGTVTLLFTDIEGSTQRWDSDRTAMQAAVRRHDEIMRAAIAGQNGRVFKTIGDAFCAVFWHPEDAVAAAMDIQRTLGAEDFSAVDGIRVRIALHSGTTDARDGDYFGPTVNRVARLLSTAHGGQVILSGITAELARPHLGTQASLRDLGEHRLKDLTSPERIFQLVAAGLDADFPKLRSLSVLDNNLPQQLSSFVGREADVAEIKALFLTSRLVTLFGAGGVGKTRCAIQVGAELLEGFHDGVWFVDFAPLTDGALVAGEIATVFHVQEAGGESLIETLAGYLRNKNMLLIFDNCEHLIQDASNAAALLLRGCPKISILATSRESLAIPGETVHRMPSLTVPERTSGLTAADARQYGAVALFETRSRAANPRFELTDENAPIVADVCKRLDGIPLAIELAAARVKVLAPRQLAQKLDERFRILTGGDRTALPRQQTMRALIDWSYDLLSETERTVFRRLSIFAGSFSLDSAGAVCSDDTLADFDVLDVISSLVDKSLLNVDHVDEDMRYRLLESTRQYGREKAAEAGEYETLARKHALSYLTLAESFNASYDSTPDSAWLARAIPELDNFRSAIAWALTDGNAITEGQLIAGNLYWLWREFAPSEGRRYIDLAIERLDPNAPAILAAELDLVKAGLDMFGARYRAALGRAEKIVDAFDEATQPMLAGYAYTAAGRSLVYTGRREEGEVMLRRSLELLRKAGGRKSVATVLEHLGVTRSFLGDTAGGRALLNEALTTFRACGATARIPGLMSTIAEIEFRDGNTERALTVAAEGLELYRAIKFAPTLSTHLANMAAYLIKAGRYDEAQARAREALELSLEAQQDAVTADALQHLAAAAALRPAPIEGLSERDRARAAKLIGYVDGRYAELDVVRETTEELEYERAFSALEEQFGSEKLALLLSEGRAWTQEQAVSEARVLHADEAVAA